MKNPRLCFPSLVTAAVISGALLAAPLRAQDGAFYRGSPKDTKVRIDGSSNIHDWSMTGTIIGGTFELPPGVQLDTAQANIPGLSGDKLDAHAEVSIPVNSMQSGTEGMDSVMQQAMNAKDYPRIVFHLTDLTVKGAHTPNTPFQFEAKGELSLNGITNKITMPVTIENTDKKKLKITGSAPLKMTDFKVPPPVKLGVFVTKDAVKITFEWMLTRHEKIAGAK
jgi:polyisoprenoid-binding protein YceI